MAELNYEKVKKETVKKKKHWNNTRKENNSEELEIKKMKQGMSYSCKEKTIILNVFKYFRNQNPEKCVTEIVRRTAKATGCSEKSIFQFRKEESSVEGFKEPAKTKIRKNININSRDIKYDNSVRASIRNIIYDLQFKNIVPSLNTILKQINADTQMPKFSVMTLRRLMFDMGFSYQKNGNKFVLIEKPDNRLVQIQQNDINNHLVQQPEKQMPPTMMNNGIQQMKQLNVVPPSLNSAPAPGVMHMTTMVPGPVPQHDSSMMAPVAPPPPPPDMLHPHSHNLMMNSRRDMMHPMAVSHMDLHRKRDPMTPWMHGIIKQGQ